MYWKNSSNNDLRPVPELARRRGVDAREFSLDGNAHGEFMIPFFITKTSNVFLLN